MSEIPEIKKPENEGKIIDEALLPGEELLDWADLKKKKTIIHGLYDKFLMQVAPKMTQFSEKLKEKYPDWEDYKLYHFLFGSTMHHPPTKLDFPGDDSVVKFMNDFFNPTE